MQSFLLTNVCFSDSNLTVLAWKVELNFSTCGLKCNFYGTFSPRQLSVCRQSSAAPVAADPAHCIWKQAYISQELFHRDSQAEK